MNTKLKQILSNEEQRQQQTLGMIPSENFTSRAVREAVGSVLMHKYSEGYPYKRYYEGNEYIDELESLCLEMVLKVMIENNHGKELATKWHANVQVLSGSSANLAVYNSILEPGDTILSMYLPDGGHLSHGWSYSPDTEVDNSSMVYLGGNKKVNFTSKLFNSIQYKTNPKTNLLDYVQIRDLAISTKPKLIITGGTAYPREINYRKMRQIADEVGAYYHADVAHEAGLIAGGAVTSPFEYADFVTFTTHKTLRGPKGAVAMCRKKFAKKLDRSVFPGLQGGPFNHTIAGLTQALFEADTNDFRDYARDVVSNAIKLAAELEARGFKILSGGTDKHLVLVDMASSKKINGRYASRALSLAGIIANMNTVPYEKGSPKNPSGVRFGTPILTTRGMGVSSMSKIAELIDTVIKEAIQYKDLKFSTFQQALSNSKVIGDVRIEVEQLCQKFPLSI